jgi:hypothetical protein
MLTLSDFYESVFGLKTYKLSLDAGCTCPNRDGTKAFGGCIFCSEMGSGDFAASRNLPIKEQVLQAKKLVEGKLKGRSGKRPGKYIAYFQNFTSTYGDAKSLLEKYKAALECEDVEGLALATRPDCLGEEILSEIGKIAEKHFVQIELGLQTSNEKNGKVLNLCYTPEDYLDCLQRIKKANRNIHVVTHLIFGLPGEGEDDMLESVKFVMRENELKNSIFASEKETSRAFGIKITSLYVLKNTVLEKMFEKGEFLPLSKEEYFALLGKTLKLMSENCVIHRLTGDPPKKSLIAPAWMADKKRVMNELKSLLR